MYYTLLQGHAMLKDKLTFLQSSEVFCGSPLGSYIYFLYDIVNDTFLVVSPKASESCL